MYFYDVFFVLSILGGLLLAISLGGNDVANAMASAVGSRALTIRRALFLAAAMNVIGAVFLGGQVTATITSGIVNPEYIADPKLLTIGMFAALLTAGVWMLLSTFWGFPVSSTHSIVGGVLGMGLLAAGDRRLEAVHWHVMGGIALSWILSPVLAGLLAWLMYRVIRLAVLDRRNRAKAIRLAGPLFMAFTVGFMAAALIFHTPAGQAIAHRGATFSLGVIALIMLPVWLLGGWLVHRILDVHDEHAAGMPEEEMVFCRMQIVTSAFVALSQGANDVANAMGPVAALYLLARYHALPPHPVMPVWLLLLGGGGIALGIGLLGKKVITTLGERITRLNNPKGYSVDFSVATTVLIASLLGIPVSSSTCAVGAVTGVGVSHGLVDVNFRVLAKIFSIWIITVPVAALTSGLIFIALKSILC